MTYAFHPNPTCAVCGSSERRYIGTRRPRTLDLPAYLATEVFQCLKCELVYPDPLPSADREQADENYSDSASYFPQPLSEERFAFCKRILDEVERVNGTKGRLLDLGSGRGELLSVGRKLGWTVMGVEPSKAFAAQATEQFGVPVVQSYIESAPLPDERFDVVTLLSVLEQSSDPVGMLRATLKWLKPGGLLYLETTNQAGLVLRAGDFYYRLRGEGRTSRLSPTFPSFQLYGYSPLTMQTLFTTLDCEVVLLRSEANRDPSSKLREGGMADRCVGLALHAVNFVSRLTNTGAVMTTAARLPGN